MFGRSRIFMALVAVALILATTVTVLAQSGSSTAPLVTGSPPPAATLPPEFSSALITKEAASPPTATAVAESTLTQEPDIANAPHTSTPHSAKQEDIEEIPPLTPFTLSLPVGTPVPEQQVETPLRLMIPAIGVDATIEWVGVDDLGNMGVPSSYRSVAWFEKGPRPGMTGNAVIAGHLDSRTGPAVFYRLSDLQPGDEIVVIAHDGEELRFAVDGMESFDSKTAPVDDIFGLSSGQHLNLITCEGTFDPAAGQYNKRLVVYSTLVTS